MQKKLLFKSCTSYCVCAVSTCNSCVVDSQITELCLEFICYDPNYNYGSDDEDEFMETDMEEDEEELVKYVVHSFCL